MFIPLYYLLCVYNNSLQEMLYTVYIISSSVYNKYSRQECYIRYVYNKYHPVYIINIVAKNVIYTMYIII